MKRDLWLPSFVFGVALLGVACTNPKNSFDDGGNDEVFDDCCTPLQLRINKDVDILFVIDNSASMGEAQANLAVNVDALVDALEAPDVAANYRIGVTTTDNGNPWCPAATSTPEFGNLMLSSCKTRLDDFVFGDLVDAQDLACNDLCTLTDAELEILPSSIDGDPDPVARPWLENIEGKKNIPAEIGMADAFRCFGPQGVNGCGFESPLESMYLALARAGNVDEANYGFIRDDAVLAIVIVTDEVDCSHDEDWADIFAEDGNKVFWSDPSAAAPTSALCWNAGVECTGDPGGYDSCEPVNKSIEGNLGANDANAVLHPMRRYVDLLQGIEDRKQELVPTREVIVMLIAGVTSDGDPFYADDLVDLEVQNEFGIGAGCTTASGGIGVPPVRMRVLGETFTPDNMFSICSADYTPALLALADEIEDQIEPACFWQCAGDTNSQTAILEPECILIETRPGIDEEQLEECERNPDGSYVFDPVTLEYAMPSDEVDVCYALRVDAAGSSSDPADDMSPGCIDFNYNLEFAIARRTGAPAPGGTAVSATCSLSESPALDCPNLGMPD